MSVCKTCNGEEKVLAYYASDQEHTVREKEVGCYCVGGPSRRYRELPLDGEREVNKAEADRLTVFWSAPVPIQSQAAA
jgi:hypothetical protein